MLFHPSSLDKVSSACGLQEEEARTPRAVEKYFIYK